MLRLHNVDPVTVPCAFTRDDLETIRRTIPTSGADASARAPAGAARFVAHERAASSASEPGRQLRLMPARSPRVTNFIAILRLASSIISSPNITAPRRSPSVVAFS